MNGRKREILAGKFLDLGNYAVLAISFSQFIAEKPNWNVAFLAVVFWVVLAIVAIIVLD